MNKIKNKIIIGMVFLIVIVGILSFSSAYMRSIPQYVSPGISVSAGGNLIGADFSQYCRDTEYQDFILQIDPAGCEPPVVRSDILEEQNFPVFCPLSATKLNPLIKVEAIDSIHFSGQYPREVASVGFHPARAALGVRDSLNSPVLDNIGYVVINLKRQPNESAMPEYVEGNLTARIRYDIKEAFGIGKANFYLPVTTEEEWSKKYIQYGFWDGKAYVRAEDVNEDGAKISVYIDENRKLSSASLEKGETSQKMFLPSMGMCSANFQVRLNNVEAPRTRAKLLINSEVVEVADNEKFLDNKCQVLSLTKTGLVQDVKIKCDEDGEISRFPLRINPKIELNINGISGDYSLGDQLYSVDGGNKFVYIGYMGENPDGERFIIPVVSPARDNESFMRTTIFESLPGIIQAADFSSGNILLDIVLDVGRNALKIPAQAINFLATGNYPIGMIYEESSGEESFKLEKFEPAKNFKETLWNGAYILAEKQPYFSILLTDKIRFIGLAGAVDEDFLTDDNTKDDEYMKQAYDAAIKDYDDVLYGYAGEQDRDSTLVLGEQALYEKIKLAFYFNQKVTALQWCDEFRLTYPESDKNIDALCSDEIKIANSDINTKQVSINGKIKDISFEGIIEPTHDEYGAVVYATGFKKAEDGEEAEPLDKRYELRTGIKYPLLGGDYFELISVKEEYITVRFNVEETAGQIAGSIVHFSGKNTKIKLNDYEANIGANKYKLSVNKINIENIARVSIIPSIDNMGSEADFKFKIGIEKRNIQLAPKQINKKIDKLDKSIENLEGINNNLEEVVRAGKVACAVTSAALAIKNFAGDLKGQGIARQKVMRNPGGWYDECNNLVNQKKFTSSEQCLLNWSDQIDKDVLEMTTLMGKQDENFESLQKNNKIPSGFFKNELNSSGVLHDYSEEIKTALNVFGNEFKDSNGKGDAIDMVALKNSLDYSRWVQEGNYDIEQLREIELNSNIFNSNDPDISQHMKDVAEGRLYSIFSNIQENSKGNDERYSWANDMGQPASVIESINLEEEDVITKTYQNLKNEDLGDNKIPNINGDVPVQHIQASNGKNYILVLDDSAGTDIFTIAKTREAEEKVDQTWWTSFVGGLSKEKIYEMFNVEEQGPELLIYDEGGVMVHDKDVQEAFEKKNIEFKKYDETSFKNQFKEKDKKVRYYENEPYKGLPAIVPFDTENGWYAATRTTLPIFGNIGTYDSSGRINSFYLCNIGKNQNLEFFSGFGDEDCALINLGTGQSYNTFPGLSPSKAKNLVDNAKLSIEQASQQYGNKVESVRILGKSIPVGEPAVEIPEIECQDFMSPKDCNLMFNVCDPFICPSSRCDFGGKYPVRDVVQSGVIGSTMLCLPNWNEGIYVPVCLSGIYSGLDGWLNIQKSYRDCLQTSLDTGETVGICDEIYSIYGCELFWRQAAPLAKLAIPNAMSIIMGQDSRGGGEYLSVQNAWENAGNSIDYFKQYYAANSFRAFKARTTEEVGSVVCKLSVSAVLPGGGSIIDALTIPDVPHKAHGRFDEILYTTATNPPMSQYKVFYHIDAGRDTGAYYRVYLKGDSSSYYQDASLTRMVASGYIPVGQYISETPDFLAPSGYKELCISINGQEYCGFKEVSTSFAVEYVQDQYIAEQVSQQDIKTTKGCVSGSASNYALLTPNLGESVDSYLNPDIYNRGIIRICATSNPGRGTDQNAEQQGSRWVEVGYCDDTKMKCWLDQQSVKDIANFEITANESLKGVTENYMKILTSEGDYIFGEEFEEELDKVGNEKVIAEKLNILDNLIQKVFYMNDKANTHYIRGNIYRDIAKDYWIKFFFSTADLLAKDIAQIEKEIADEEGTSVGLSDTGAGLSEGNKIKMFGLDDNFISPIFEFGDGTAEPNFYYKYKSGNWFWSPNEDYWVPVKNFKGSDLTNFIKERDFTSFRIPDDEKDQRFISSLNGKNYEQGLKLLIIRTKEDNERRGREDTTDFVEKVLGVFSDLVGGRPSLYTKNVQMNEEGLFMVEQTSGRIYFNFSVEDNEWWVSFIGPKNVAEPILEVIAEYDLSSDQEWIISLMGQGFYDGAIIIFGFEEYVGGGDIPHVSDPAPEVLPQDDGIEQNGLSCQEELGDEVKIVAISKKIPSYMSDEQIKADTGAKNFECLVLQQALQESSLQHCKEEDRSNCLYCDGGLNNDLNAGDDGLSLGIMQINIDAHPSMVDRLSDFETNVDYGIDYLIKMYNDCKAEGVDNWAAALNAYNGWGCVEEAEYSRDVLSRKDQIIGMFPECEIEEPDLTDGKIGDAEIPEDLTPVVEALEAVEELIEIHGGDAEFSDSYEISDFIYGIYFSEILTAEEYDEINGLGFWGLGEEDLDYVADLLREKLRG